jgi:hypothetical protein
LAPPDDSRSAPRSGVGAGSGVRFGVADGPGSISKDSRSARASSASLPSHSPLGEASRELGVDAAAEGEPMRTGGRSCAAAGATSLWRQAANREPGSSSAESWAASTVPEERSEPKARPTGADDSTLGAPAVRVLLARGGCSANASAPPPASEIGSSASPHLTPAAAGSPSCGCAISLTRPASSPPGSREAPPERWAACCSAASAIGGGRTKTSGIAPAVVPGPLPRATCARTDRSTCSDSIAAIASAIAFPAAAELPPTPAASDEQAPARPPPDRPEDTPEDTPGDRPEAQPAVSPDSAAGAAATPPACSASDCRIASISIKSSSSASHDRPPASAPLPAIWLYCAAALRAWEWESATASMEA